MTLDCPLLTAHCPHKKNLLAFSAGIDSSALFYLLLDHGIAFDIAMVDYGVRDQSKSEIAHGRKLAHQYGRTCYSTEAPKFDSHFEANARMFRYRYFEDLIREHGYANLLTAHQLNDQLEWFLMRLSKGAGLGELLGIEPVSRRDGYTLVRPLLGYTKDALLAYLQANNYPYFIDESNHNLRHERNRFRRDFSDPLIRNYADGIQKSFAYLKADKAMMESQFSLVFQTKQLRIIALETPQIKAMAADRTLKKLGYLLTGAQRREIAREDALVVGGTWAVACQTNRVYIAPYRTVTMPKSFKERCRQHRIPPKIRPYLYEEEIDPAIL